MSTPHARVADPIASDTIPDFLKGCCPVGPFLFLTEDHEPVIEFAKRLKSIFPAIRGFHCSDASMTDRGVVISASLMFATEADAEAFSGKLLSGDPAIVEPYVECAFKDEADRAMLRSQFVTLLTKPIAA